MSAEQQPLHHVRGVIFDMDGTLADSIERYYRMACDVAELAGAPPPSREWVCTLMGSGDPNLLRKLLPPDYPDLEATLGRIVRDRLPAWMRAAAETEPLPGCVDLLQALHARGRRLGIATSSGRELPYLDRWGVRHLFQAIVGREDVRHRKPHPEVVVRCLEQLAIEPSEAAYVGDSPIDIEAGRAAGVHTIAVLTGTSTRPVLEAVAPDHILESAVELLDLIGGEAEP
jgi:HAD superfamily hydrolase (TIGR01509 family)